MNINIFKPLFDLLALPYPGPYIVLLGFSSFIGLPLIWAVSHRFALPLKRTLPLWIIVSAAGLIGSKIFHVLFDEQFGRYMTILREQGFLAFAAIGLNPFHAGHVFYGGIGGSCLAGFIVLRYIYRESPTVMLRYYDLCMLPAATGLFLSRIGCFLAGCCYGIPSDTFGVSFPPFSTAAVELRPAGSGWEGLLEATPPLIPTQLIEAAASLALFVYLVILSKRALQLTPGYLLTRFFFWYAIARFSIEFLRNDIRGSFLIFSTGQWMSLAILAVLGIIRWRKHRRPTGSMGPIGHIGLMGLMLTVSTTVWALPPEKKLHHYVAQHWSVKDGLPHNAVRAITRSSDGFVWIATPEGLARFDGARFTVFGKKNIPGLSSDRFSALVSGPDGSVWAGTEGGDLLRCDAHGITRIALGKTVPAAPVTQIAPYAGGIWTVIGDRLFRIAGTEITERSGNTALAAGTLLAVDPKGFVVATVGPVVSRLTDTNNEHTTFSILTGKQLSAFTVDTDGTFWVGTATGEIIRLAGLSDPTGKIVRPADGMPVNTFATDGAALWAGMNGTGLSRLNGSKLESFGESSGLRGQLVRALYRDTEGDLWVGTEEGLSLFSDGLVTTLTSQDGLSSNLVYALAETPDGALWVGTRGGGLNRYQNGKFTVYTVKDGLPSDLIGALSPDDDGTLWIGSPGGTTALRNGAPTTYTTRDGLTQNITGAILRDRDRKLWVGTINGDLHLLDKKKVSRVHRANRLMPDMTVTQILEDRSGRIWVGASFGLSLFNNGYIKTYTQVDGLSSRSILTLTEDTDMNLWIGTYRGGLNFYREGRFSDFSSRNGLPAEDVYAVLIDDADRLWLSTNNGIWYLSRTKLIAFLDGKSELPAVGHIGLAEGMKSIECTGGVHSTALRAKNGLLYFSTIKGLTVVDPAVVDRAPRRPQPQPYIAALSLDGRTITPVPDTLTIPVGTARVTITTAALFHGDQKDITFHHRLDGIDADWVTADKERTVDYRDLKPGIYTFNLRTEHPGIAGGTTAQMTLRVERDRTPLLIAALIAALIAFSVAISLYLLRKKRSKPTPPEPLQDPVVTTGSPFPPTVTPDPAPAEPPAEPRPRYEKNRLDDETAENMLRHITRIMDEKKPYRDPELTLPQLAETVDLNTHLLSQLLNDRLNKNFNTFINEYRVDEIKRMLENPENRDKLLSIAYDAGFSSKTTFNTIFKKCTGKTPSEYRRALYGGEFDENEEI